MRRLAAWLLIVGLLIAATPFGTRAERPVEADPASGLPAAWVADEVGPQQEQPTPSDDDEPVYVANRILVRFEPGATNTQKQAVHEKYGGQVVATIPQLGVQIVKLYDDAVAMVSAYQSSDVVTYAEPDYLASVQGEPDVRGASYARDASAPASPLSLLVTSPNDPLYSQQWHHDRVDSPRAWDYARGEGITVAIVDTGVNCAHADLSGRCVSGYDFVNGDTNPDDDHGHGTHVAGISSAHTNNGVGVAGNGWSSAIMPMKALDRTGNGAHSAIASAITWAVDNGADVVNLSLGGMFSTTTLRRAVDYAIDHDVTVVAAAGNEGTSNPSYPAAYPNVIAVAATTQSDTRASFSNYGNHIDISAPGVAILSTVRQGGYQAWSGTSMASPVVSGVAALLLDQDGSRTPNQIEQILEQTADDIGSPGWDQYTGYGRIDAGAALAFDPDGGQVPTPSPTITLPAPTPAPTRPPATPASDFVQQVEDLINLERADQGRGPLHTSAALREASGRHSYDMATSGFCGHGGSDGSSPESRMRDAGYGSPYGEIVACGQVSPASVVQAWMDSSPHRSMILCASCTEIGGGYGSSGGGYLHYWTVTFGTAGVGGAPTPTLASSSPEPTRTPGPPTDTPTPEPPTPTRVPGSIDVELTPVANRVGWVVSTEPYQNHFDGPDMYAGYWDGKVYRGAMQFDLEALPENAYLNYARLEIVGRSAQFLGTTGTWSASLLGDEIDENFSAHGYAAIAGASVESTLLPLMGVVDMEAGRTNLFNFTEGQLRSLGARVAGTRLASFRIDGPTSGTAVNLFTWDTGYTDDSRYPGPKLILNYSIEPPTPEATLTPTNTPGPTDTPVPPTQGPPPTETATPVPPTATDTPPPPPPTHTPTYTPVPPLLNPVRIVPDPYSVGWVRQYEPGNHFGEDTIFSGYYQGLVYVGAFQFDLSAIPPGSEILGAQLSFTGLSDRYLSAQGNGLWRVKMLQATVDPGWPNHSFPQIAGAGVFAQMSPELRQYDLGIGRENTYEFSDVLLQELAWRAQTTKKLSFRIDGPRYGISNVFAWDSGYGPGLRSSPVLSVVYGPAGGGEPRPTTPPEEAERVAEIVEIINTARADAGVAPLAVHPSLRRAAEVHNFDMTFHDFFSHTGSDGSTPDDRVRREGYDALTVGQLLAARSSDAQAVVDAWLARSQRDVMLDPAYTEIGAAYTRSLTAAYQHYWTVVLAAPKPTGP